MMIETHFIYVDPDYPDGDAIDAAARVLRGGGLVAFATETVYGLGADATDPEAVARIYEAKGRPAFNPLIVHVSGVEMARSCTRHWPPEADALAARFWPGPLTLVLARGESISRAATAGGDTVGIRMPRPRVARALIERTGRPIAAPSANRSTGLSPTLARHVLKDLDGKIDMVLDSGPTGIGLESTVLDLMCWPPRILRPGAIAAEPLSEALGAVVMGPIDADAPTASVPLPSPGRMPVHYAPRTDAVRVEPGRVTSMRWPGRFGLLVFGQPELPPLPAPAVRRDLPGPVEAAAALYAILHDWDDLDLDRIVVVPPPDSPEWAAIRDRLRRATRPG